MMIEVNHCWSDEQPRIESLDDFFKDKIPLATFLEELFHRIKDQSVEDLKIEAIKRWVNYINSDNTGFYEALTVEIVKDGQIIWKNEIE